jgi:Helix-turn-helix domain of resolvase
VTPPARSLWRAPTNGRLACGRPSKRYRRASRNWGRSVPSTFDFPFISHCNNSERGRWFREASRARCLRRERQLEGIAKAKAAGVYNGRPAPIDAAQVRAMKAQGKGASEIAKALKIGRASVYRVLEAG